MNTNQLRATIREVVEDHDALCLDELDERERLIRALTRALTNSRTRV